MDLLGDSSHLANLEHKKNIFVPPSQTRVESMVKMYFFDVVYLILC